MIDELDERGIKYSSIDNVADLKKQLVTAMQGIKRVPSLLYYCPENDVYSSELKYYEIMACEPLHDIKEHIDNIYREIPCHMNEAKNDIK